MNRKTTGKYRRNVSFRRFLLFTLAVAGLMSVQESGAQTGAATNPVGFNWFTLPAGDSLRVNTFVQATAYEGAAVSITSASNSVVTVSGSGPALTSGSFNETASGPAYFMEVLGSGGAQGLTADVVSNTAGAITVNADLPSFGVSGTTPFCVRPHTTLSSLFPATTPALSPYVDSIELFFPNNTSQSYLFTGTGDGWIVSGAGTDAGSQIIYPGQGFVMTVQTAKSVPVMGSVKPGPTLVPLYAGANNLVGTINPVLSGTQTLSSFDFPATFTPYVDSAQLFYDTGALQSAGSCLSSGTNMINAGTGVDSDSLPVNPSNSVIVNVGGNEFWTMPSFYTPGN